MNFTFTKWKEELEDFDSEAVDMDQPPELDTNILYGAYIVAELN